MLIQLSTEDADRLVAGQCISSLSDAVKELVENALDAEATAIDIRLGNDASITVSDDGMGIDDFTLLGIRSSTSKLNADKYGFRGEALAALTRISAEVMITSATSASEPEGHRIILRFDSNIQRSSIESVARRRGTTVTVKKLFANLPIRHQELMRRFAKELQDTSYVIKLLAISRPFVRFNVWFMRTNNDRCLFQTIDGENAQHDVLIAQKSRFCSFFDISNDALEFFTTNNELPQISVNGWISKFTDRQRSRKSVQQILLINGRPATDNFVDVYF